MKRHTTFLTVSLLTLAILLLPGSGYGQNTDPGVTGAGEAGLPAGTVFSLVPVTGLEFGLGVFIPGDGSADGQFHATLLGTTILGQPQEILIIGTATAGTVNADGSRTFSGLVSVDMGLGAPPQTNIPFSVTAAPTNLQLTVGSTTLPVATVTVGTITIQ